MSSEHKGLLIAPFCKWNMARSHSPTTPRATSLVSVSCHKCIIGFIINIIGRSACWLGYSLMSCVALPNLRKEKLNVLHLDPPELLFVSAWAGRSCDFKKFSERFRERFIQRCIAVRVDGNTKYLQFFVSVSPFNHSPECEGEERHNQSAQRWSRRIRRKREREREGAERWIPVFWSCCVAESMPATTHSDSIHIRCTC